MNNIQIFKNEQFGEIRTVVNENNEPMFCLADLCKALNLSNPTAVASRLDVEDRAKLDLGRDNQYLRGNQEATFVTEAGLYEVIIRSDSPIAKSMRKWVTSEVLPSIRKHGGYITSKEDDTPELIMARALQVAQDTLERHRLQLEQVNNVIKESAPKVQYYEEVLNSKGLLTVNSIANDLGMSAVKLNRLLAQYKIQYKEHHTYVLYAQYRDMGLIQHVPHPYLDSNGETRTTQHMYWTEKGRQFIFNAIKGERAVLCK